MQNTMQNITTPFVAPSSTGVVGRILPVNIITLPNTLLLLGIIIISLILISILLIG